MQEITTGMSSVRIMMGPVDHPTLSVPFVLARKGYLISHSQAIDPGRNVNIMGDKHRVARLQAHNKPLVSGTFIVIGKNLGHGASLQDGKITGVVPIGVFDDIGGAAWSDLRRRRDRGRSKIVQRPWNRFLLDRGRN